ncbi:MAG: caspase family protein [Mucilaginibacter sp.]|uniref:caspase family protein n=1 Tax=Mucilaginibacter sp. TaxID=1882438 RepID=UPI0034E3ABD0
MNVAIVIGVSEYTDIQNNLPGCKKDAEIIHNILIKTGKYDSILYINEKLSSAKVKEKPTNFISENKGNEINELIFYFTGHGEFQNNEFYYILSDFNDAKRKQTSLQNDEVDSLIKTLNPDLVVKIIDACQSGKAYIKEADIVVKYFNKTLDKFNNCYFLNSSLKDQSSLQTDIISDFTLSFIKSIKEHDSSEIRYKDIIDYISDEFENNPIQTPFFVSQADYTEKFCVLNLGLKEYLVSLDFTNKNDIIQKSESLTIIEKIRKQAAEYYSKEQAIELINEIKKEVSSFTCSEDLKDIYNLEIIFSENYDEIIDANAIGKWLDENPHDFFAKSIFSRVRKDRHTNPFGILASSIFTQNDVEYESIRAGFDLEIEVPYKTIIFDLDSNFPNIDSNTCRIIYLLSKRQIRFFYFITNFETKNWDERTINKRIEWFYSEHLINDTTGIIDGVKKIYNLLETKSRKEIDEKFNKQEMPKQ